MEFRPVCATLAERTRRLPGDALIAEPARQFTHAVTIHRPPRDVWPWLVQMGAGTRAGWYSYDRVDNGGHPSATRVLPYLQQVRVGTLFPALPGRTDGFHVLQLHGGFCLVLGWRDPDGEPLVTWAFVLEKAANGTTRLVTRSRAGRRYAPFGLPRAIGYPFVRAAHFLMQRKQLLGIAARVEAFDPLLDRFMPDYDVVERDRVKIAAPMSVVLEAARRVDLRDSMLVQAIVKLRAAAMGATTGDVDRPRGLLAETTAMGWRILAEDADHEIVVGAAAQPWLADVRFVPIAPDRFAAFAEPDYVKIAWTLRVDPACPEGAVFSTETRVVATDRAARIKFRRYWARVRPGAVAIRRLLLRRLERNVRKQLQSPPHGRTH